MNAKERFSGDPQSEGADCYWFHAMEARTKNAWIFFHYTPETKQLEGVKSGFDRNHHHVTELRMMRTADSADFSNSEKAALLRESAESAVRIIRRYVPRRGRRSLPPAASGIEDNAGFCMKTEKRVMRDNEILFALFSLIRLLSFPARKEEWRIPRNWFPWAQFNVGYFQRKYRAIWEKSRNNGEIWRESETNSVQTTFVQSHSRIITVFLQGETGIF